MTLSFEHGAAPTSGKLLRSRQQRTIGIRALDPAIGAATYTAVTIDVLATMAQGPGLIAPLGRRGFGGGAPQFREAQPVSA